MPALEQSDSSLTDGGNSADLPLREPYGKVRGSSRLISVSAGAVIRNSSCID